MNLILKSGEEYEIDQKYQHELSTLFPQIDLEFELRKMRAWLLSNPAKRKTKRGIKRFIGNWINRALDRYETHQHVQLQKSKSEQAGDTVFGEEQRTDHMDMGQASGSLWASMDRSATGQTNQLDYQGGMGSAIIEVSPGSGQNSHRELDQGLPPKLPEDSGTPKNKAIPQTIPLFAESEMQ